MNTVIIGAQWGDEGKGKITDLIAGEYDAVVRFQGGNNAGHTIVVGEQTYKLHLIPSGILYPEKTCILGNGVVLDPAILLGEIDALQQRGVSLGNLHISDRAHVIMPYHKILDGLEESLRGKHKIGTTNRGIGPCYTDKIARVGIRMGEFCDSEALREKLQNIVPIKQKVITAFGSTEILDIEAIIKEYSQYAAKLKQYVIDSSLMLEELREQNKKILFEGAQGSFLCIDSGTYPYVTSSNTTSSSACAGAGVSVKQIHNVIGILKAYTTRVGEGPFPTEISDALGEQLRKQGHEFGTTTGRPRRCGWLDLSMLKYAHRINGFDSLALTKLDVLQNIHPLKICTHYEHQGNPLIFSSNLKILEQATPVYEEMDGWQEDISQCQTLQDLPKNCQAYIKRIEEISGIPVKIVSVGPKREQTIMVK